MTIHLNRRIERPDLTVSKKWKDLTTDFRRIFKLEGDQEIIAIEVDEDRLTLQIKTHDRGNNLQTGEETIVRRDNPRRGVGHTHV